MNGNTSMPLQSRECLTALSGTEQAKQLVNLRGRLLAAIGSHWN